LRDELLDMLKDSLNKLSRRFGLIERNVVGNSIEIAQCRPQLLEVSGQDF
jgi:hypothetical protein